MRADYWSNNTWANWLKDHGVPEGTYALVEVLGWPQSRGKKVVAISKQRGGDDLAGVKRSPNKRYEVLWYKGLSTKVHGHHWITGGRTL